MYSLYCTLPADLRVCGMRKLPRISLIFAGNLLEPPLYVYRDTPFAWERPRGQGRFSPGQLQSVSCLVRPKRGEKARNEKNKKENAADADLRIKMNYGY